MYIRTCMHVCILYIWIYISIYLGSCNTMHVSCTSTACKVCDHICKCIHTYVCMAYDSALIVVSRRGTICHIGCVIMQNCTHTVHVHECIYRRTCMYMYVQPLPCYVVLQYTCTMYVCTCTCTCIYYVHCKYIIYMCNSL